MQGKRTRMRAEERRAFILAHAKKVFAQHGYAEASTGTLAQASEVTEPMLYKHFGSKKGLFLAVLGEFGNRFLQLFSERLDREAEQNILEALGRVLVLYRETIMADPDIQKVLFQAVSEASDAEIGMCVRSHNERIYMMILHLLERAQQEGIIRTDVHLEAATWGCMSVILAMQYNVVLDSRQGLTDETLQEVNRLWLKGLCS